MKKNIISVALFAVVVFCLLFAVTAHAQETYVSACATKPACTLTQSSGPVAWSNGNQVWIVPLAQGTNSMRLWIRNLNPTTAHTSQSVKIFTTDDGNATSLLKQADRWVQVVVTDNVVPGAQCVNVAANAPAGAPGANGKATCYTVSMLGVAIAIQINGAVVGAGSPDTFELGVYQGTVVASGPQPGDRQYEVAGELPAAQGAAGTNPLLTGCATGIQLIPTAAGQNQYVSCDVLGDLNVVGPTGSGTSFTGFNPVVVGNVESGSIVRPIAGQSAASVTASSTSGQALNGITVVTYPADWSVAVQATTASACVASLAAQAGTRHCATGVTACVSDTAAQAQLFLNLRDGATGAGTIRWNALLDGTAGTSSCIVHEFSAGPICGTANTAMTLEFGAATAATNGCTTTVKGYDVN